jgi:hypothetical protein
MLYQNQQTNQISQENKMKNNRETSKKVVRVVSASALRRLDNKVNREKKKIKALRRMRSERDDE